MNAFLSLIRKKFPGVVVELMELIYRFIFVIWEEAVKIHIAQASRLGYRGFRNSIESLGELVTTVFIRAFRRVERVSVCLESRGFEGNFDFLMEEEKSSGPMKAAAVISCVLMLAVGITERLLK
jgi:cobalt/nickel transport system permease protein